MSLASRPVSFHDAARWRTNSGIHEGTDQWVATRALALDAVRARPRVDRDPDGREFVPRSTRRQCQRYVDSWPQWLTWVTSSTGTCETLACARRGAVMAADRIDYTRICFVIMPFGTKKVADRDVDFDFIYSEVFAP